MSAVHFEDDETVLDSGSTPGGVEKWGATAVAYQLLAYDIMKGFVKKGMKPSAVQQRRQHFQEYDSKRFANNMNNMLKRHAEGKLVPKLNMQKIQQTVNALEKGNGGGRDTTSILNSKLDGKSPRFLHHLTNLISNIYIYLIVKDWHCFLMTKVRMEDERWPARRRVTRSHVKSLLRSRKTYT
jgi:hypothetical protein